MKKADKCAAFLHGNGCEKVRGVPVHLKTVSDLNPELASKGKDHYSYEQICSDYHDFMEAVAYNRAPASDFALAYETARIMYAAYQSAEEGRRIDF